MNKTALVVDDSAVARHTLRKLLTAHGIAAEEAESAEAALDHLKHQRPDVIFMDHMMPGMDGFQALEAIKANPATATIPVMMYTSQEGELYVGQARALGAFGVLPKDLKPVEVDRVLRALHLIPGGRAEDRGEAATPSDPADGRRVTQLLEELFRQQRSVLREEIREGYERALESTQSRLQAIAAPLPEPPRKVFRPATVAAVLLGALAATFAFLYFNTTRLLQSTTQQSAELIASSSQLTDASARALSERPPGGTSDANLVEFVQWALNQNTTYGFDDVPLSEALAQKLLPAIRYAAVAGFEGRLLLRVHVGRFCMNFAASGMPQLAPPTIPVTQCEQVGWLPSDAFALGRRQTLAFARIVTGATNGTKIRVETMSVGADEPAVAYPAVTESLSAGEWNRVAASNHRVEIKLLR
jgi:CheY-like chemotaxis protein